MSVAFSIWAAMNGSTGRNEPSAIPSEIIDANRSEIRLECSTITTRICSGRAVSAEVRKSGPCSDNWNSPKAAAQADSLSHWLPGSSMANRWARRITSKVRSKQTTTRPSLAWLW